MNNKSFTLAEYLAEKEDTSEIIEIGKRIFNFHPNEPFASVEQILEKSDSYSYPISHALYAWHLARFIDKQYKKPPQ